MSKSKWLVAAVVPGIERQPLKKLDAGHQALLNLLHHWRIEAARAGHQVTRIVVVYEAGRDERLLVSTLAAGTQHRGSELCRDRARLHVIRQTDRRN
jgi:transposase